MLYGEVLDLVFPELTGPSRQRVERKGMRELPGSKSEVVRV